MEDSETSAHERGELFDACARFGRFFGWDRGTNESIDGACEEPGRR